jgi:2-hydroxy-6-oxonona-2,4-dienedioate hydrolase
MEFGGASLALRGFYVIALSRFGYLRTPLPDDASPAAQADAFAALLDALGITRTAIVGISAGAPSAMQFAIRHSHRCTALALLVPFTFAPSEIAALPRLSWLAAKLVMMIVKSNIRYWLVTRLARNLAIKLALGTPPAIVRAAGWQEQMRAARILDGLLPVRRRAAGIINDLSTSSSLTRYELERIEAPTLVLGVRDDWYGTFAGAQYTASQIPRAQFVSYDSGGHMWIGHDNEVLSEIVAFLTP